MIIMKYLLIKQNNWTCRSEQVREIDIKQHMVGLENERS